MTQSLFGDAIRISTAGNRTYLGSEQIVRGGGGEGNADFDALAPEAALKESDGPRGLALNSIQVDRSYEGLSRFVNKYQEIYWVSVAFDLSGMAPVVLPPAKLTEARVPDRIRVGETIVAGWGSGAPVFGPKPIVGALFVYVTLMEADGAHAFGQVLKKIHKDLDAKGSLLDKLKALIKNPEKVIIDEVMDIGFAAMQPIATILTSTKDDKIGLFAGVFEADKDWSQHLVDKKNGATVTLTELG